MDEIKENCGIFGIINIDEDKDVYANIYYGIFAMQHRGQESAGIAIYSYASKQIELVKTMGLVMKLKYMKDVHGSVGIGHVRYSTTGASTIENAQPLKISYQYKDSFEEFAIAHNGNIINVEEIKQKLQGMAFTTTSDSEVIANLIVYYHIKKGNFYEGIVAAMNELVGSYCLSILYKNQIIAVRDPYGFRPYVLGESNEKDENNNPVSYCVASESCALDAINFSLIRDINPGEVLIISKQDNGKLKCKTYHKINKKISYCMFEYVYFSRADSIINNTIVYNVRKKLGKLLAEEAYVDADIVAPVPESGITAALGFMEWCIENNKKIKYGEALMKNRYSERSFILPGSEDRYEMVKIKMNPIKSEIKDKKIILIDDSIVRGTTMKTIIKNLRAAGVKEIHVRITCPPILFPCKFGIDMHTSKEFIARAKTIEELKNFIDADSLYYLSIESLIKAIGTNDLCLGCLTGKYPISKKEGQMKLINNK